MEPVSPPPHTKSPSEAEHYYTPRQAPSRAQSWNSQPASPPNVMLLSPPPSAIRMHPNNARIHRIIHHDPLILGKIFAFSSSSHLRAEAPFLQDRTSKLWLESLRNLKALCLVSKPCYAIAAPLLYTHIRLRRIPQLSALVASLQLNYQRVSKSQSFTPPVRLGGCTQSLDLSFFIPKEWNTLYVSDLLALLPMLPNLTSFRSRPCLQMLSQSGAPLPRPVPSAILQALAHSLRNNSLLTELELTQQESPALTDLAILLQNSVNLSTLTLGFHIFDSGSALPSTPASIRLPSLESLKLHVTMNRPKGVLTAKPAAHLMIDASRWAMPNLRNLSLVLDHDIQALSSDSPFGGILHGFLNMHGDAIRHLSVTETAPHLRSKVLDVSSLVSKCPLLECLTVGIMGCAPVRMVVPHIRLRRVQFVGTLGWLSGGGDVLRELGRRALEIQAAEVRAGKFPGLREVMLMDEREVPRRWAEVMRSVKVSISCRRAADEGEEDTWSDGEGSDDDDWVHSPTDGDDDVSSEGDEDDGWYTDTSAAGHATDGEKSDDETIKNSSGRTTSYMGDDQIDHHSALEIFEKSLERVVGLPKHEDFGGGAEEASRPTPAHAHAHTRALAPAPAPAPAPIRAPAPAPTPALALALAPVPVSVSVPVPTPAPSLAPAMTRVLPPATAPLPIPTQVPTPTSSQYPRPSSSPTRHRRVSIGPVDLGRSASISTSVSGHQHQRRLSKDQTYPYNMAHPSAPPSAFAGLVSSVMGSSSTQGHHRRLSTNGSERPTLPPLSLSAQQSQSQSQSHTVPITITAPTPTLTPTPTPSTSHSRRVPTPTFAFGGGGGSSSRAPEPKPDADEGTIGSARKKVFKPGSLKFGKKPKP